MQQASCGSDELPVFGSAQVKLGWTVRDMQKGLPILGRESTRGPLLCFSILSFQEAVKSQYFEMKGNLIEGHFYSIIEREILILAFNNSEKRPRKMTKNLYPCLSMCLKTHFFFEKYQHSSLFHFSCKCTMFWFPLFLSQSIMFFKDNFTAIFHCKHPVFSYVILKQDFVG